MRSIKWAVAALALSNLTGCFNTEPELYRVALAARPVTVSRSRAPTHRPAQPALRRHYCT